MNLSTIEGSIFHELEDSPIVVFPGYDMSDKSLIATTRALLWNRYPKDAEMPFTLACHTAYNDPHRMMPDELATILVSGEEELKNYSPSCPDADVREILDLNKFLKNQARVFIADKIHSTLVAIICNDRKKFADNLAEVESVMPRLLPWFFKPKEYLQEEVDMLNALYNHEKNDYLVALHKLDEKYQVSFSRTIGLLKGFKIDPYKNKLQCLESDWESKQRRIKILLDEYNRICRELEDLNLEMLGLRSAIEKSPDNSDLVDLFMRSKMLQLLSVEEGEMKFIVKGFLTNVDSDMYEAFVGKPRNPFYIENTEFDAEEQRLLTDAIFSSRPKVKLLVCAEFKLYAAGEVAATRNARFPSSCEDYVPNAHLNNYSCLGDYLPRIRHALKNGDVPAAVLECTAAAQSQNVGETPTMNIILSTLFSTTKKCIQLPNGTHVTPNEAIKYLMEARS